MGFFTTKKEVKLEDFCRDFYETQILNPRIGEIDIDATASYAETIKKLITEEDSLFANVDLKKLTDEFIFLRFELFALACTHKFISGERVLSQSAFTKRFLEEKKRMDIWEGMKKYNDIIEGGTLVWFSTLGNMNLSFNYNMKESLTKKNIEEAKKNKITDDVIERENHRLWSEDAWKQKTIAGNIIVILCNELNIDANKLNQRAQIGLVTTILGFYNGAKESWKDVKIIN